MEAGKGSERSLKGLGACPHVPVSPRALSKPFSWDPSSSLGS